MEYIIYGNNRFKWRPGVELNKGVVYVYSDGGNIIETTERNVFVEKDFGKKVFPKKFISKENATNELVSVRKKMPWIEWSVVSI